MPGRARGKRPGRLERSRVLLQSNRSHAYSEGSGAGACALARTGRFLMVLLGAFFVASDLDLDSDSGSHLAASGVFFRILPF